MPTIPLNVLAFLSEWLALRMGKKGVACRRLRPQKRHLHSARAGALKRSSPATKIPFFTRCLAGFLLYCQLSPSSTAPCSADFIGTQRGFLERIEKCGCRAP